MRGKLRDKFDAKHDRSKRETLIGRRPARRDQRNLQLQHVDAEAENEYELTEDGELAMTEGQQN